MSQASRYMRKINLDSSGQMDWKVKKMDVGDQLGNGSLNEGDGSRGDEEELASQTVRKLLEWPWTIDRKGKKGMIQNRFKASGIMVDSLKEIWTQKEEQQGKYDEFSSGLAKLEILGRPSSRHFYHATQKIRMKLK